MDAYERLLHYAAISSEDELSRAPFSVNTISGATIHRRNKAVSWIDVIISLTGCDINTKHTCIQIFDRYITSFFLEENKPIENWKFVSLTAAAATLIGIKIHYSKKSLTVNSFPYFQAHDLVNCERLVLEKLDYAVDPCDSPICFMKYMLHLWTKHKSMHEELLQEASRLVDKFILSFESIQYSPMTIAVSALLLTSLKLGIESSDWLQNLPSPCYTSVDASGYRTVDKCLESFRACSQKTFQTTDDLSSNNSPTTVAAMIENKFTLHSIPAIPTPSITPTVENLGMSCSNYIEGEKNGDIGGHISCSSGVKHSGEIGYTFAPIHTSSSRSSLDQLELKRPVPRTLDARSKNGKSNLVKEDEEEYSSSSSKYRKISMI